MKHLKKKKKKKKKHTCFTACQYLVGVYKRHRLQNRSQFFLGPSAKRTWCASHVRCLGNKLCRLLNKLKISNKASLFLSLFRRVYFLSKANVKNRSKIRDGMLTWLMRVTDFRSHTKGHHAILCDVYYLLTNDWSDENFSKSTSLVCGEFSVLFVSRLWLHFDPRPDSSNAASDATCVCRLAQKYETCYKRWGVILSCKTLLLVWQLSASRLISTACFGVRMVFDFQS